MTVAGGTVVSDAEAVEELRAAWAQVSRAYARCWAAMAEVASRTTLEWETAEVAAALTFTTRRADDELCCAQTLLDKLPRVYAALATGELDHHKARVFISYLGNVTPAQAERISARLVPRAPGWTTGQLAEEAAAAAARLESLADALRAAGYPATLHQTRADLFLRLLDGSLDGLSGEQILATMLTLGPLAPADPDPHSTHPPSSPPRPSGPPHLSSP